MKYMLDTNICAYVINHKSAKILNNFRKHYEDGLCISSITLAELMYGVENSVYPEKNRDNLLQFTALVSTLSFGQSAVPEYGKLRAYLQKQGMIIGAMDMLIAAHAKSEGLILVTNNTREFERVPRLQLENWI